MVRRIVQGLSARFVEDEFIRETRRQAEASDRNRARLQTALDTGQPLQALNGRLEHRREQQ